MIDTHCHLNFEEFDDEREEIIKDCKDKLTAVINSGTSLEHNIATLKLAQEEKDFIYPSLGFHPVSSADFSEDEIKLAQDHIIENIDKIAAIGEVGMDFFYVKDKAARERQKVIFRSFAELAQEYEKPIIIHSRDADKKALNIITEYSIPDVVFHCYGGSLKTAKRIMDEDYYMSFSTMLCYSKRHQELAKEIPLEYILTETDSPYLSPLNDGKNKPYNVIYTGQKLAEINEMEFSEVEKITENNARKVFNML